MTEKIIIISNDLLPEYRNAVLNGDCPWCNRNGFKSIAQHIRHMHGIKSRELRDILKFTYSESICSTELREKLATIHNGMHDMQYVKSCRKTASNKLSETGKEKARASIINASLSVTPEMMSARGKKGGSKNKGKPSPHKGKPGWNKDKRLAKIEHGTRKEYRKGCRCEECCMANSNFYKEWRAAKERT